MQHFQRHGKDFRNGCPVFCQRNSHQLAHFNLREIIRFPYLWRCAVSKNNTTDKPPVFPYANFSQLAFGQFVLSNANARRRTLPPHGCTNQV